MSDPVLLGAARLQMRGQNLRVKTYGEAEPFSQSKEKLPAEVACCKRMAQILYAKYPGHPWSVEVNAKQGIAFITIPPLLGTTWGYIIKLDDIANERDFETSVKEAGGNILERFNIPRSTIDIARYIELGDKMPLLGRFGSSRAHRALIPA